MRPSEKEEKNGGHELIPDLRKITWHGRRAYIVFDYEPKEETRENVRKATERLAKALYDAGAEAVRFVVLPPPEDPENKQGVDDFLLANSDYHDTEAFNELLITDLHLHRSIS